MTDKQELTQLETHAEIDAFFMIENIMAEKKGLLHRLAAKENAKSQAKYDAYCNRTPEQKEKDMINRYIATLWWKASAVVFTVVVCAWVILG